MLPMDLSPRGNDGVEDLLKAESQGQAADNAAASTLASA
jgi:hypothetical protein